MDDSRKSLDHRFKRLFAGHESPIAGSDLSQMSTNREAIGADAACGFKAVPQIPVLVFVSSGGGVAEAVEAPDKIWTGAERREEKEDAFTRGTTFQEEHFGWNSFGFFTGDGRTERATVPFLSVSRPARRIGWTGAPSCSSAGSAVRASACFSASRSSKASL